jgi:hypothetical protein
MTSTGGFFCFSPLPPPGNVNKLSCKMGLAIPML